MIAPQTRRHFEPHVHQHSRTYTLQIATELGIDLCLDDDVRGNGIQTRSESAYELVFLGDIW